MSFAMAILCLFIGSCLIWVAAHGTSATSPYGVFQQVIAGFNGEAATAAPGSTEGTNGPDLGSAPADSSTDGSGDQ